MASILTPTSFGAASGPFNIELTDCMGDSVSVINANTNYLASYTAAVSSTVSSQINTATTTLSTYATGTALLSSNGYQIFPGGLIMQWGFRSGTLDDTNALITLPIAFPNAILNIQVTLSDSNNAPASASASAAAQIISNSQIRIYGAGISLNPDGYWYFVTGH